MESGIRFRISSHAEWEMRRRGIEFARVEAVMNGPEQRLPDETRADRRIYQSRVEFDGKLYLLRLVVADGEEPPVVVTVYRTSKIEKYWSPQ